MNDFLRIDLLEVPYDDFLGFLRGGLFWACIVMGLIRALWHAEDWGWKIRVRVLGVLRGCEMKGDTNWVMLLIVWIEN